MTGTEWTQAFIPKVLCHWLSHTLSKGHPCPLTFLGIFDWIEKVNVDQEVSWVPLSWWSCWTLVMSGYMALFLWCGLSSEKGPYRVCWQLVRSVAHFQHAQAQATSARSHRGVTVWRAGIMSFRTKQMLVFCSVTYCGGCSVFVLGWNLPLKQFTRNDHIYLSFKAHFPYICQSSLSSLWKNFTN